MPSLPLLAVLVGCAFAQSAHTQRRPAIKEATGRVEGVVFDGLGKPVVGQKVWVSRPASQEVVASSLTDGEGLFVVGGLPTEGLLWIHATAPSQTVRRRSLELVPGRPLERVQLRLWPATRISGRVVDPEGRPVAGAQVLGASRAGFLAPPREVETDDQGRFELTKVPIGDQVLRVWKPGLRLLEEGFRSTKDSSHELSLARGGGTTVAVHVKDLLAFDATNVRVGLAALGDGAVSRMPSGLSGNVDRDGQWRVEGLLDDRTWRVTLHSDRYVFGRHAGDLGPDRGAFRQMTTWARRVGTLTIRGTIRTTTDEPLDFHWLQFDTDRSIRGVPSVFAKTDGRGQFTIDAPAMEGDRYTIRVDRAPWVVQPRRRRGSAALQDPSPLGSYVGTMTGNLRLQLVAAPGANVRARLTHADGSIARFQVCELQCFRDPEALRRPRRKRGGGLPWHTAARATTDRSGLVEFPTIPLGSRRWRITTSGGATDFVSPEFRVDSGDEPVLRVEVPKPTKVVGTATGTDGRALAGRVLSFQAVDADAQRGSATRVLTDRAGRFAVVGVFGGDYRISLLDRTGKVIATKGVQVDSGEAQDFDVVFDR